MSTNLVFLSGKRTAFGSFGGSFAAIHPTDLALVAAKGALEQAKVDPKEIDHIILGNVLHSAPDSIYTPRHTGLRLGAPDFVPALGVNRLCGSGFQVVIEAAQQLAFGDSHLIVIAGVENMSMSPYVVRGARFGLKMGHSELGDVINESLFDTFVQVPMAITAEKLGEKYGVTRIQSDDFALRSQQLYSDAEKKGKYSEEITPLEWIDKKKQKVLIDRDEHPKPKTDLQTLSKLRPVFKSEGLVTAGNASGIVDGSAAMVVCSESLAKDRGLKPLGRLIAYGIRGCDPRIMGIGPVPASQEALRKAGLNLSDIDLIEINEAFAPQVLAVEKEMKLHRELLNVNGGAIAVGHPLAATGLRITLHLLYELRRRNKRYGLGAACIGGGQGIALIVEAIH